jgi:plastocyanin
MSGKPEASNVSRRQFLAVAGSVAAASSFAVGKDSGSAQPLPPAPTPADPLVTIDITAAPISYSASGHNAYRLKAKNGDIVKWQAKTSSTKHRVTILFLKDTPFSDGSKKPLYAFHGSEADEAGNGIGGTIDDDASGTYEYYVAVFDDKTNLTYTDDPKIIVGSGNDAGAEISLAVDDLKRAGAQLSSKPKLQKKIESIEDELVRLGGELK